jgi:hypothetical protein
VEHFAGIDVSLEQSSVCVVQLLRALLLQGSTAFARSGN